MKRLLFLVLLLGGMSVYAANRGAKKSSKKSFKKPYLDEFKIDEDYSIFLTKDNEIERYKCCHCPENNFIVENYTDLNVLKRNLKFHLYTHKEKIHPCSQCGKLFSSQQLLKKHETWHTKKKERKRQINLDDDPFQ